MSGRDLLERFAGVVGAQHVVADAREMAAYATDWRKRYVGMPLAVVRPGSTAEVGAIVKACAETRTAIVPQGGNTGLCGGATPDASGKQIVVNLGRMNRIRLIDPVNNTMTVEAGCVLANLQQAADEADRLFPLSLAAEGSCAIGGNLSTNAGGVQVLRYGNTRELVLGLEVVLPSGEVWDGLRGLRKDNTGYDLKHLFVGAEGTLGIITAAVLKLFPKPRAQATALAALATPRDALRLLEHVQAHCGDRLTAFELLSAICLDLVRKHVPRVPAPFAAGYPQYALIELSDTQGGLGVNAMLEATLGDAIESGLALDAVVAASVEQARNLWALRENVSEAQAAEGQNIKHDISIPISRIGDFIANHRCPAREGVSGHPHGDVRPLGRRQPALQRVSPGRRRRGRVRRVDAGCQPRRARQRRRVRRLDQRGARHRTVQAGRAGALQVGGGDRADACRQARARSARDHESGEGALIG